MFGEDGSLEVIFGPMFSGKSTELLRRIRRYKLAQRKCLVIKYRADCRYNVEKAVTHDQYVFKFPSSWLFLSFFNVYST